MRRKLNDPYNNRVTYHTKWDTAENRYWHGKVRTYLRYCDCMSDCPLGWATEVFTLMAGIDRDYGIYKKMYRTNPLRLIWYTIYNLIRRPRIVLGQIKEKFGTLRIYYTCTEKDGTGTEICDSIERRIKATEILLSAKGAYWPTKNGKIRY